MLTVAIVNDCKHLRTSFAYHFQNEGFAVREYPDTQSALELCDNPTDVALIDRNNPPFDGIMLYRRIRMFHGMPVIILSAWATEVQQELIKHRRPAQAAIDLPASSREVIETIKAVLASKPF
jgi:two-component system response regulator ChvI